MPIPASEFERHVDRMHTDGDHGFSEEYAVSLTSLPVVSVRFLCDSDHLSKRLLLGLRGRRAKYFLGGRYGD